MVLQIKSWAFVILFTEHVYYTHTLVIINIIFVFDYNRGLPFPEEDHAINSLWYDYVCRYYIIWKPSVYPQPLIRSGYYLCTIRKPNLSWDSSKGQTKGPVPACSELACHGNVCLEDLNIRYTRPIESSKQIENATNHNDVAFGLEERNPPWRTLCCKIRVVLY